MGFDKIIRKALEDPIFKTTPPVLLDIGASGDLLNKWKILAPYCICIAFDADERDFQIQQADDSGYLKLYKINRIVVDSKDVKKLFYLTKSPYCSSVLPPNKKELDNWRFASLFDVDRIISLPTITLMNSLNSIGVNYIDWFKSDSQGTDLRLYKSIDEDVRGNILAVDLEPGILDAYIGEDKIHSVLKSLEEEAYWISSMRIMGTERLNRELSHLASKLVLAPGWAEITALRQSVYKSYRLNLLLVIFALVEGQWGFALEICNRCKSMNSHFAEIEEAIVNEVELVDREPSVLIQFLYKGKALSNRVFNYLIKLITSKAG